jgi:succinate dehydrogenase / fumarate reductase flavoprotein subunit/fumarate reductase flavoprotein subunit
MAADVSAMTLHPGIPSPEELDLDLVVVGSGAAGLMAVRHAAQADPGLRIALVSKGLPGRSGCSVMVMGYNAALGDDDDPTIHFADLVEGGGFLSDQTLAAALAADAPGVVAELADRLGCAFDRDATGRIALGPFPGQSRHRKVTHRHLTGLEIVSRLRDDLVHSRPLVLADTRALDLLVDDRGVMGVVALDIRRGVPLVLRAPVVVLATGGSVAASYRVATPAREKSGDGLALALRAGLPLRDMEMVQFLSVGLAAGASKLTGALLEEALRFAGAELRNAEGEAFMERYDERGARAPRDVVASACYAEILDGRGTPHGGVWLDCRPVGREALRDRFDDLVDRARLVGVDLATAPVSVAPAAHIGIGGIVIDEHGRTALPGLLAAGEDAGGVHGASWAGGNGIAESTVFGRRAGRAAAAIARERPAGARIASAVDGVLARAFDPLTRPAGPGASLAAGLGALLWERLGLRRDASGLAIASDGIAELRDRALDVGVAGTRVQNGAWQDALDLGSRLTVAQAAVASAATRTESRGVHIRADHPARDDARWLRSVVVRQVDRDLAIDTIPIVLDRLTPAPSPTAPADRALP